MMIKKASDVGQVCYKLFFKGKPIGQFSCINPSIILNCVNLVSRIYVNNLSQNHINLPFSDDNQN